ncbi:MAG TPA: hypothetical protein VFN67_34360 [Polyangiales bacterium]|nr:hypothetical protein [Polyangiales bacterium]
MVGLVPSGELLCPNKARAQAAKPYRLGLLQLESDAVHEDTVAPALMAELRNALPKRTDYEVVDTHVSLTQLSLAEDCIVTELSCLGQISEKLTLDGFLFGKVTHDDGEVPMASFRRFDRAQGTIQSTAIISFGSERFSDERMQAEVHQLLNKLLGPGPKQALAAIVAPAPTPTPPPAPVAETAAPAPASTAAATAAVATATPKPADPVLAADEIDPKTGVSARKVAGYVLLGGAAASVGMSVLSFVQVDRAANNASFQEYRGLVGANNATAKDVCDEANAGKRYNQKADFFNQVKSSCSTGSTFEVLQYVFIGSALVTGGLATFLLLGGGDSNEKARATGLQHITLHPSIGRGGASLSARMRF